MKRFAFTLALFLFLIPVAGAQTGEDLFQQALRTERLSGNMEAAIALYEQVVEEHGEDRELSSRALLQLARAYESQGRAEARRAYGRLVSEYADYPQVVAEARVAYERLAPKPEGPAPGTVTVIKTHPDADSWGAVLSPDGTVLAALIYEPGAFALHDLETGAVTLKDLNMGDEAPGTPDFGALSPDGTKLAATWFPNGKNSTAIRVRHLQSGRVTQVITAEEVYRALTGLEPLDTPYIEAYDWTSDGGSILIWFAFARGHHGLALVHIDGSPPTKVADFGEPGFALRACITSDSRYVIAALSEGRSYIERFDVQTGERATWRSSSTQSIDLVGCVDNPSRVLFSEDFLAGKRLMSGRVDEVGGEVEVHANVPSNSYFGVPSRRGDAAYWPLSDWSRLTASVDPVSMELNSPLSSLGSVRLSMWSPIGNRIAWYDGEKSETVLWDADSGSRTILDNPTDARVIAFSADGTTLKMHDGGDGLYLDLETGDTKRISKALFQALGISMSIAPDLTGYEYAFSTDRRCLVRIDMTTEEGTPFWCPDDGLAMGRARLSPDHSKILVERRRTPPASPNRETVGIAVIDAKTGAAETLLEGGKGPEGEPLGRASWAGNDAILVTGHSAENLHLITSLNLFNLGNGEFRPVLGSLLDLAATAGDVQLSHDRRHVIIFGSPRDVGGDPNQATIIHRAVEVRADR